MNFYDIQMENYFFKIISGDEFNESQYFFNILKLFLSTKFSK